MPVTFTYNKFHDFNDQLDSGQFDAEIDANTEITAVLNSVTVTGNTVKLEFMSDPSAHERMVLRRLIKDHSPGIIQSHFSLVTRKDSYNSSNYQIAARYVFPGSSVDNLVAIKVTSYMDSGATSYDIRLRDVTNEITIATANFTNTDEEINDLGALSNIPSEEAKLEFHIKRNGGNKKKIIYIESISMYFGK